MRRPEGSFGAQGAGSADPGYTGNLKDFIAGQRREYRGDPPGGERFARPWRPDHEQGVAAGCGYLDRPAQVCLPAKISEVWQRVTADRFCWFRPVTRKITSAELPEFCDRVNGADLHTGSECCLGTVGGRQDDSPAGAFSGGLGHGKGTPDRSD
jgi:hypothetical protein